MSFKILLLIVLVSLMGCGVKAPPLKDPEIAIDSYLREYTGEPTPTPSATVAPNKP